jgi:hypothetical protein
MTRDEPRQAYRPADTPAAAVVAVLIAIALIAIGIIAGREFLIRRNIIHTRPWLRDLLEWLSRMQWHTWLLAVGFGGLLLGVLLLAVATKPRNRRHIGTRGTPALWLRPTDVARAATAAALRVDGVDHARTIARKRTVEIHVWAGRDAADLTPAVLAEATEALAELTAPPRIRIHHTTAAPPTAPAGEEATTA